MTNSAILLAYSRLQEQKIKNGQADIPQKKDTHTHTQKHTNTYTHTLAENHKGPQIHKQLKQFSAFFQDHVTNFMIKKLARQVFQRFSMELDSTQLFRQKSKTVDLIGLTVAIITETADYDSHLVIDLIRMAKQSPNKCVGTNVPIN